MFRRNWKVLLLTVAVVSAFILSLIQYRRAEALQDRLGCVATGLEKAKTLHQVQMKEPGNFTGDTMQKLMDSVDWAYECATKGPFYSIAPGSGSFGQHGVQPH